MPGAAQHRFFSRPRLLALGALCVLTTSLLVVPAAAQVTAYGVALSVTPASGTAQDGACVDFTVTVENTGQSPIPQQHRIPLAVEGPGSGWTLNPAPPPSVALPAGESTTFPMGLCPGEAVEDGATARVQITATVEDDVISQDPATDSIAVSVTASDDRVFGFDLPDAALWVALGLIAILIVIVLLTRKRQAVGGVEVACPEPAKEVTPGQGTSFPIRIRNEGRDKDIVTLTTSPLPRGWDTFLPLVDVPLEAREEQTVWLSVKSPDDARPGDRVIVKIIARSANFPGQQASIDTMTTVAERSGGGGRSVYTPDEDLDVEEEDEAPVAVKRKKASSS